MTDQHTDLYKPELGRYCDHTVLKAFTTRETVRAFCAEAIRYGAASVCVNPVHVAYVRQLLAGTPVRVCSVIGFPLGATTPAVKAFEAAEAVRSGADELDMVINVGALRDGNSDLVYEDILGVVRAAAGKTVKVILETCYLSDPEKEEACRLALKAGADFVKTSTGFGTRGASVEDIRLMKRIVGDRMKIKASTGINTQEDALRMIAAGAVRLGLSKTVQVVEGDSSLESATTLTQTPVG
ncbi:MAG TPA: deoxyribose-phosphate aldolase [Clostridiales bacterium]|nr:deoxyribose-phosphate aldolase [Clostridiales bacterium]